MNLARRFGTLLAQAIGLGFLAMALTNSALAAPKVVICHGSPASALIPLAKIQGYFAAQGLDVELRLLPSGFQSLQAMLKGECTLATAAAPPVSYQSLRRNDFRILASISSNGDDDHLIVRRDRGISKAADLRGRRVAVPEGTSANYFLDTYLTAHGVAANEVVKTYLPPQEIPGAFRRGDVDAAALWEPHLLQLAREFGAKAAVLASPGLVVSPFLLLAQSDTARKQPAALQAILRALINAERFAREQPAKAKAMMASYYGIGAKDMDIIWPIHDFQVSLHQPLLFILESVARWQIRQMPVGQQPPLPNFLEFLSPGLLRAIKPGAVTVID